MKRHSLSIGFLGAITIAATLAGCSEKKLRHTSASMEPTIRRGEVLTIDTKAYTGSGPARWDVIVFESPLGSDRYWVFRVVGLPGESVDIRGGKLWINGAVEALPPRLSIGDYELPDGDLPPSAPGPVSFPYKIPADNYFVLGDNVANALDSRYWGALARSKVLGRVAGK